MRILFALIILALSTNAAAGKLKVKESFDEFTQERMLQTKTGVCPYKAVLTPCITLYFIWAEDDPYEMLLIVERSDSESMREIQFRIFDEIHKFPAVNDFTDVEISSGVAGTTYATARSGFVVDMAVLTAIVVSDENRLFRINGINNSQTYTMNKSNFFKKPHKTLSEFLSYIADDKQTRAK